MRGMKKHIALKRDAWNEEALDDVTWKDERRPSSIRQTLEHFQRQRWENFRETGWSTYYGLFLAHRYHLELNWTDKLSTESVSNNITEKAGKIQESFSAASFMEPAPMSVLCTNVLLCARVYVFACVRYTSVENSYVHGHTHMCVCFSECKQVYI